MAMKDTKATHTHTHAHAHAHARTLIHTHAHTHTHARTLIHTCTRTHTHTCTHAHTQVSIGADGSASIRAVPNGGKPKPRSNLNDRDAEEAAAAMRELSEMQQPPASTCLCMRCVWVCVNACMYECVQECVYVCGCSYLEKSSM